MEGGTIGWMSPELLDPGRFNLTEGRRTKESDCYALGMVIYEVLSGQAPFAPLNTLSIIMRVMEGVRPGRPEGKAGALFTNDLWEILELCWKHQASERISAKDVLQRLDTTSLPSRPSSDVDLITETGSGEQLDATTSESGTLSPLHRRSQAHHQSSSWYNRPTDCIRQRTPGSTKRLSS